MQEKTPAILQEEIAYSFLDWHQVPVAADVDPCAFEWRDSGTMVTMPLPNSDEWAALMKQELRQRHIRHIIDWSPTCAREVQYMTRIAPPGGEWGQRHYGETEAAAWMAAVLKMSEGEQ
ncbi:MAG: hypothetical protein GY832_26110 [Chloroflexi bacterium]|nr:hypothetical protein [Chloroflexota bacterium]